MIRTTAPQYPDGPYNWNAASAKQCSWYCYYRAIEEGYTAPCYGDRATKSGSYNNAKEWLKNFREPGVVMGPDYVPVHGDIAVFNGNYGHVVFIERAEGNNTLISEYNRVVKQQFNTDTWNITEGLKGCGPLLGYLHFPNEIVKPVQPDDSVNQIETTDTSLRIRLRPNLSGEVYGYVQIGYYNVLSQTEADGYVWYEIEEGKYCADITTIYHPKNELASLRKENYQLKDKLVQIHVLSNINKGVD